ncbi:MAG: hypothetical protein LBS00_03920, partial [Synergistaceae bacterium]|nr:hypothetical protein [Synergistaceae bacterium]
YGGGKNLDEAQVLLRGLVSKGYTQLEETLRQVERRLADRKAGVLEADVLSAEIASGNASFDQRYKDKRIVVAGWVNALERLNDYGYVMKLGGADLSSAPKDNAMAVFYEPSRTGALSALKSGAFVKLSGVYVGNHPFPLEDCAFTLFGCSLVEAVSEDKRP